MKRAVVCVATAERYQRGMNRLFYEIATRHPHPDTMCHFWTHEPAGSPQHSEIPYAFKAHALRAAERRGADLVLWCDACILPIRSLEPLWERIEREGYWISRNGWTNYEWTADSAYPDLFPEFPKPSATCYVPGGYAIDEARALNRTIPHVVATSFGLNLKSDIGKAFLDEYFRLASETRAFCGPWINHSQFKLQTTWTCPGSPHCEPCGPPDVLGHRHDQTAASVIAWRLGMKLTDPPEIFAYGKAGDKHDERTILVADGSYE